MDTATLFVVQLWWKEIADEAAETREGGIEVQNVVTTQADSAAFTPEYDTTCIRMHNQNGERSVGKPGLDLLDLHEGALRDAGFREVGTIWQNMHNRVVLAVR